MDERLETVIARVEERADRVRQLEERALRAERNVALQMVETKASCNRRGERNAETRCHQEIVEVVATSAGDYVVEEPEPVTA